MITLRDSIEIKTTPDKIYDWFKNLDNKRFTEWHPNHKKFVRVTGGMDEGDIIYFEECVGGKRFKVNCKISKIEKTERSWAVDLESIHWLGRLIGARISFIAEAKGDACVFTHVETFGLRRPLLSSLILRLFKSRIPLIEKDMKEDNVNLRRILEEG